MSLLRRIVWLFLPAQRYLDARSPFPADLRMPRSGGPVPYVAEGEEPPSAEELAEWARACDPGLAPEPGWTEEDEAEALRRETEQDRLLPETTAIARRLVPAGSVRERVGDGEVEARLVRFWRGQSVLEASCRRDDGVSAARTTVPRGDSEETVDQIARQLALLVVG